MAVTSVVYKGYTITHHPEWGLQGAGECVVTKDGKPAIPDWVLIVNFAEAYMAIDALIPLGPDPSDDAINAALVVLPPWSGN